MLLLILSAIAYVSIKIGISPMPSSLKACKTIMTAVVHMKSSTIIDVGSGFGILALYLASKCPNKKIIGYEISYFPWLISVVFKFFGGYKNLQFYRKNFLQVDFPKDCILVCYLFPQGMSDLDKKLDIEKKEITCLVSNTFALGQKKPKEIIRLRDMYKTPIYIY